MSQYKGLNIDRPVRHIHQDFCAFVLIFDFSMRALYWLYCLILALVVNNPYHFHFDALNALLHKNWYFTCIVQSSSEGQLWQNRMQSNFIMHNREHTWDRKYHALLTLVRTHMW